MVPGLEDRRFADLPDLLQAGDLLVVNHTRVRAARLRGLQRGTGGVIELLLTRRIDAARWQALVRPARRLRQGAELEFDGISGTVLTPPVGGVVTVSLAAGNGDVEDVLASCGEVPLPPYFDGTLEDTDRYQTIYAKRVGSAAAPTAGLHFTQGLIERLRGSGVDIAEVDLEVGLDTFRPIETETVSTHAMHSERFEMPPAAADAVNGVATGGVGLWPSGPPRSDHSSLRRRPEGLSNLGRGRRISSLPLATYPGSWTRSSPTSTHREPRSR